MFKPLASSFKDTGNDEMTISDDTDRPNKKVKTGEPSSTGVSFGQALLQQATPRISIPQSETALTSVKELRSEVVARRNEGERVFHCFVMVSNSQLICMHPDLEALVKNHVFVGVVGPDQPLSAVQHHQKLLLVNHVSLA